AASKNSPITGSSGSWHDTSACTWTSMARILARSMGKRLSSEESSSPVRGRVGWGVRRYLNAPRLPHPTSPRPLTRPRLRILPPNGGRECGLQLHQYRLGLEVRLQPQPALLVADAAFLVAAERQGRVDHRVAVDPHGAGLELAGDAVG